MEEMMRMTNQRKDKKKGIHRDHYMEDDEPKKKRRNVTNPTFKG